MTTLVSICLPFVNVSVIETGLARIDHLRLSVE